MSRLFSGVLLGAALTPGLAAAADLELWHQGRLFDTAGAPVEGDTVVTFRLYDAPTGGAALWSQASTVPFDDGYFTARLGSDEPLPTSLFAEHERLWLGLSIDGTELSDRVAIVPVPFAARASIAEALADGAAVEVESVAVGGTTVVAADGTIAWSRLVGVPADLLVELGCGEGEVAMATDSGWACAAAGAHVHDAADVPDVLSPTQIPIGSGDDGVAAGDHSHDLADLSGEISRDQLPVGTGSDQVAAGEHDHDDLGAVALAEGTTVGGAPIATGPHLSPFVLDYRHAQTSEALNLPKALPWDDSVPQSTEGNELLAVTIAPKAVGNVLVFQGTVNWVEPSNHSDYFTMALFQDGVASALATATDGASNGNARCTANGYAQVCTAVFRFTTAATADSPTTYRLRVGLNGGNVYINRSVSGRRLGGTQFSTLSVTELAK